MLSRLLYVRIFLFALLVVAWYFKIYLKITIHPGAMPQIALLHCKTKMDAIMIATNICNFKHATNICNF